MHSLDLAAAEMVRGLKQAGIESVLLRGPAVALRLYDSADERPATDVDLLLPPGARASAIEVLVDLGYRLEATRHVQGSLDARVVTCSRARDGASADLHETLGGALAPPASVWQQLSTTAELQSVGGEDLNLLGLSALALSVSLHAARPGRPDRSVSELERALVRLPRSAWVDAAELARRLEAVAGFTAGLRLTIAGASLADELGLPVAPPASALLGARGGTRAAVALAEIAEGRGLVGKARRLLTALVPRPAELRARSALARRGVLGTAAAYLWRPFDLAFRSGPTLREWLDGRRASRARRTSDRK